MTHHRRNFVARRATADGTGQHVERQKEHRRGRAGHFASAANSSTLTSMRSNSGKCGSRVTMIRACIGEREQLTYMVTNTSDRTIDVELATALRRTCDGADCSSHVRLSVVPLMRAKRFGWVRSATDKQVTAVRNELVDLIETHCK